MKKLYSLLSLFLLVSVLSAQSGKIRITGKVTDGETGEPLPGVNIIIEGTTQGTITDISGKYSILVADDSQTLVFNYLGFVDEKMEISESLEHKNRTN